MTNRKRIVRIQTDSPVWALKAGRLLIRRFIFYETHPASWHWRHHCLQTYVPWVNALLSSEEILSFVPDSRTFCSIDSIQVLNIDSTNIQPSHWLTIEKAIEEHYKDYDGFVITHGTDTMAYTAAALSYLIRNSAKPIVITGAQKPIDMENTDARTNLADSLRFASHPNAHGVNIVFDGKVIAGTRGKRSAPRATTPFPVSIFPILPRSRRSISFLSG